MQIRAKDRKVLEDIFMSYCNISIPKNEMEYELILGSVLGKALEIVHSSMREKTIRIITKKYHYHKYEFKKKQDIYFHVGEILSDIWRYRHLWLYSTEEPKIQGQKSSFKSRKKTRAKPNPLALRQNLLTGALQKKKA